MKVCPMCQSTFNDIVQNQLYGCPQCYFAFREETKKNFEAFGISEPYKGFLPKHVKGYESNLVNKVEIQIRLDEAIANEEYEKAAFYRDYLKAMDSKYLKSIEGDGEEDQSGN